MPDDLHLPTEDGAWVKDVQFWLVWTKTGRCPRFVHQSETGARTEAIRLAKKHPGQKFIVLAATHKFWVSKPSEPETFTTLGDAAAAVVDQLGEVA